MNTCPVGGYLVLQKPYCQVLNFLVSQSCTKVFTESHKGFLKTKRKNELLVFYLSIAIWSYFESSEKSDCRQMLHRSGSFSNYEAV